MSQLSAISHQLSAAPPPRILNVTINRRGCKTPLDTETALALEGMAEIAYAALANSQLGTILPDGLKPCGKWWFRTKAEAQAVVARRKPDPLRGPGWILNTYYCNGCDGFHIGHTRTRSPQSHRDTEEEKSQPQ